MNFFVLTYRDDTKPNGEKPEKRAKTIPVDKLVSDSSGFMNALNAVTTAPAKKKKRTNSKDLKVTRNYITSQNIKVYSFQT